MKHLLSYLVALLLLGSIFISCSEQQGPTANTDEIGDPLNKVIVVEYTFDFDLGTNDPYQDCSTGAFMQNHGVAKVYVTERTTPSGTWTASGFLDYEAYGPVTLENLTTGEIWTLHNGSNPSNEVAKENGVYRLHYHWNELYKLGNQTLHIHGKGYFTIDNNGNVTKDLVSYTCKPG